MKGITKYILDHLNIAAKKEVLSLEHPGEWALSLVYKNGRERRVILRVSAPNDFVEGDDVVSYLHKTMDKCVYNSLLFGERMDDESMAVTGRCTLQNVTDWLEEELSYDIFK